MDRLKRLLTVALAATMLAACAAPTAVAPTAAPAATEAGAATTAPEATAAPEAGATLRVGIGAEPETLDPGDAVMVQEQFVLISLFDSLLAMGPDASLHPALALSWEPNAEYSEFTFELRTDVTFHDGTPFNAAAVKASFDHIMSDAVLESGGKTLLQDHQYVETVVVDDDTVTVKFAASYPTFLRDAARQWLSISSPAALEKHGAEYGRNPVGTGPFKFVRWESQTEIVLERNADYAWAPAFAAHQGAAHLGQIVFRILPDAATRLTAIETGEVDVVADPPSLDALALADSGAVSIETFAQPGIPALMMINTEKAPTNDLNVRKAMLLAVNQGELVATAFQSLGMPTYGVLSPTTWSYDEAASSQYRYNLEEAQRLLEEAGWVDTNGDGIREKDGANLTIDYPTSPVWEEAFSELLAGYLQLAGFEVTLRPMDDAGIVAELGAGNYSMMYIYWVRADPSPLRVLFHSENINGGAAYSRFSSPELDAALADGDVQTDETVRLQDYVTAQKIIMDNALVLPMFTVNSVYLITPAVKDFSFDLEGYPWLFDVSLQP
ncbi:MAG: ABC transporter substrate-binding protein [Anaerolineales bacterium]|nr:ABC transporter substrate-binding protein [Anaerolineales bacterium]